MAPTRTAIRSWTDPEVLAREEEAIPGALC